MAQNGSSQQFAQPPAVAALKYDAGVGPEPQKVMMERTFSQDIQEGTQELKQAAEQTRNVILDLGLDGIIRWVSPSWTDVVGTDLIAVKGTPIKRYIDGDSEVFERAIAHLMENQSKSVFIKLSITTTPNSDLGPMLATPVEDPTSVEGETSQSTAPDEKMALQLEGQGIMVYDRVTGAPSHTMWMLQPAAEPLQIEIELPQRLVDTLGVGAEILAKYLTELTDCGVHDPQNHPPPLPIVCRVCERSIVPWWFERHSDLCVQEHKAEMEVQMIQESLTEHRHAIVKILDTFESRTSRAGMPDPSQSTIEYKGQMIGPPSGSSSLSSASASNSASPARSRSPSTGPHHVRTRSAFIPRRPLVRVVELILDLCDTAIEISVPTVKDSKSDSDDDFRTQSPQSDSRINQVLSWQPPSSLDSEPGLAALSSDTERLARAKVEAVHRHQVILEYGERIRQEYMMEVDACIAEALKKADRATAGEPLSSSESEVEEQLLDSQPEEFLYMDEPISPIAEGLSEPQIPEALSRPQLRSLASALRNPHEMPPISLDRKPSSQAISTGSSSPQECPTPKSSRSGLVHPAVTYKRRSFYNSSPNQDEADQSDSSMPSLPATIHNRRTESPTPMQDVSLSRSASMRDRKRRSMHLHGLSSASPHRGSSPARHPPAPSSPLRMAKARLPSVDAAAPSPIVSPLLTSGEFPPSPQYHMSHRRQSSMHSSDPRAPLSPRLSSTHSQPRAQPPSIKDFEIVKPISKGAFGSVYLSKKKLTGEYFAIKVLRKSDMIAKNQVTNVKAERAIMMWQGESDFVAKLYWTFSSKDYLFLVMEYLNGGDCASLVKILGGLTEDWAKKYVAEVVLGVEHLHSRGIVHRDLKPDNLLIDSKGHLKLTDFGLSRMGLVGRQKRALKSPEEPDPDFLKQGHFTSQISDPTSRHGSFDYTNGSPSQTPLMTPALAGGIDQPSYFSLNREASLSRDFSRRASGYRSDSGSISSHDIQNMFQTLALSDSFEGGSRPSSMYFKPYSIEEESYSQGSASPDLFPLSQSISNISQGPNHYTPQMLPLPTALFDPEESGKRFVGTPDYLAPETINGSTQDEMSDWWSLGCILFEFLYGVPPFHADTPEEVFDNILHRRIAWPDEDEYSEISLEAKDLINKLIQLDPKDRLGANRDDKYPSGGAEIQAHPWFSEINWSTLLEDEAQFVPNPENPEDTEYFDARGATLQSFPEELEDQVSPPGPPGARPEERPHDALFKHRSQTAGAKRGLMPLSIPAHIARDSRTRRLSEPVLADDFGNFTYKNLPVLEKANKDILEKMRRDTMQAQARSAQGPSQPSSMVSTPVIPSPGPSVESSPIPMTVKRALSVNKHHRTASPSGLSGSNPPPLRSSQPGSPMLVQFSTGQHHHERRKTSGSSSVSNLHSQFNIDPIAAAALSATSSPVKRMSTISPAKIGTGGLTPATSGRHRSHTVGSQDSESPMKELFIPGHHKRRSALLQTRELSPSSSDNENAAHTKAYLKVQRRRQSSRRMSQVPMTAEGPCYRPLDVLICEDHPVTRMVLERLFEKMRCRTITAITGAQALSYAVSSIQFDIIFTEFKLPEINGVDVARMIRDTKSANSSTPIVCITGYLKDLPEVHKFDSLLQKPPTIEKLTEVLCKYCCWKPPSKDLRSLPLSIITPPLITQQQNSPSSVASSRAPTMPDSSYRGSSRGDSVSSGGFFSDLESLKADDMPLLTSRGSGHDWTAGGLGISDDTPSEGKTVAALVPHLVHSESAPPDLAGSTYFVSPALRPRYFGEASRPSGEVADKQPFVAGGAEEGDDEDEELGRHVSRQKSPRTNSKLGQEMMRTNSRGSVVSIENQLAEPDSLRKSLEILEERMESLQIPEETQADLAATQPRKDQGVSAHSHPDVAAGSVHGHITPPIVFPKQPGHVVKDITMTVDEMSDPDPTPVANRSMPLLPAFDETTPRATSESESTMTPKPRSIAPDPADDDEQETTFLFRSSTPSIVDIASATSEEISPCTTRLQVPSFSRSMSTEAVEPPTQLEHSSSDSSIQTQVALDTQ